MIDVIVVSDVDANRWDVEVLESNLLTVADFWHKFCPWCIRLDPVFREVAEKYRGKAKFVKLNVLENQQNREIAIRYGIMSTPTLVFFCKGRPVGQYVGFRSKESLEKIVDELMEKHKECIKQSTELK